MTKKAALSFLIEVEPGVVYAPIGGGSASSQTSCVAVTECDRIFGTLRDYEDIVRQEVPGLMEAVKSRGLGICDELSFKLGRIGKFVVAVEENTKAAFLLPNRGV